MEQDLDLLRQVLQASFFSSGSVVNYHGKWPTLMDTLHYSSQSLPFKIYVNNEEEYEEWDEDYQPPLSDYQIAFHPDDPRCFILMVSWYDDFAYSTIYHIHVRCEAKYKSTIKHIFEEWLVIPEEEELDEEEKQWYEHYKHGHFYYHWNKSEPTVELCEMLEEAENYYLKSIKVIQKAKLFE